MHQSSTGLGGLSLGGGDLDTFPVRRPPVEDPNFDITAMIDLVFMMNIYFLFTFIGARASEIDLPTANICAPLEADEATTITVLSGPRWETVEVYLGDGKEGESITDPADQAKSIAGYVQQGVLRGKKAVLIKAESTVRLRHLRRLTSDIAGDDVKMYLGVLEKDTQ